MANRENPISWPASEGSREITKWYDEEFRKLRGSSVDGADGGGLKSAFHTLERRTGFPEIHTIPGGLPANTETASKTLTGLNFGTVQADLALTIGGVAATITDLSGGNTIEFTCPALGLTAGDIVSVDLAVAGVHEKISAAVV